MVSYTPHDWKPGEIVTDEKLDRIEVGISDMTQPSDATVTSIIADPDSDAHAAVEDVAAARMTRYSRPATDFGVELDSTADQTDKVQAALDAAAGDGFDLLLPADTIVCEGPLTWKCRHHNIIGRPRAVLDFSHATTDGPMVLMEGGRLSDAFSGGSVVSYTMRDISFAGPTDASTTVDCLSVGNDTNGLDVTGLRFAGLSFVGFRHQEVLGNHEWLNSHDHCTYFNAQGNSVRITGTVTSGENISWSNCVFYKGGGWYIDENTHASITITACSFDYLATPSIEAHDGIITVNGCHFETGQEKWESVGRPPHLDLYSDGHTRLAVYVQGGRMLYNGPITKGDTTTYPFIRTSTNTGSDQITVHATSAFTNSTKIFNGGRVVIHEEANSALVETDTEWPIVDFSGSQLDYWEGFRRSRVHPGSQNNILADSGFENGLAAADPPSWDAGMRSGWTSGDSGVTIDTSKHVSGSQCVKLSYPSPAPSKYLLSQAFHAEPGRYYSVGAWAQRLSWVSGGGVDGFWVRWFDGDHSVIIGPSALDCYTGQPDDEQWYWVTSIVRAPRWAASGRLDFIIKHGSTGTMWLDGVQVVPL